MHKGLLGVVLLALCLPFVFGCGGDDGGPSPVSGVTITPADASVEIGHPQELTVKVSGGESKTPSAISTEGVCAGLQDRIQIQERSVALIFMTECCLSLLRSLTEF